MAPIIEAAGVSKQYRLGRGRHLDENLREWLVRKLRPSRRRKSESGDDGERRAIWALSDVSFEVDAGDVVGIVGRNGAGKSTLLKILSRITDPTEGLIRIRGRMSSLLEVGTGFHQELTGRENIYLSGAILGMRKAEINARFDEIVAFSGVARFLDTPAKRYSSGMYLRLAFAVAAHLDPEVLVVDEVLAVGDAAFQRKCLGKLNDLRQGGRTVLFVSHNMAAVENLCDRGLVLQRGRLAFAGGAKEAVRFYLQGFGEESMAAGSNIIDLRGAPGRSSKSSTLLDRLELFTSETGSLSGGLPIGAPMRAEVYFRLERRSAAFDICLGFDNLLGQRIFTAHTVFEPRRLSEAQEGPQRVVCEIPSLTLVPGVYRIKVGLDIDGSEVDSVEDAARLTITGTDYYGTGKVPWNGAVVLPHRWHFE